MKINGPDIIKILNENLELYKQGKKPKNLYFLCLHDLIIEDIVNKWIEENNLNYIQNPYPRILWEENKQGILKETVPPVYVLSNGLEKKMNEPFLIYFKLFNYPRDVKGDQLLIDLISKESVENSGFAPLDARNRMFSVAIGFREDSANGLVELKKELINLFDVCEIEMDLQFLLKHELENSLHRINKLKAMPKDEEADKWIKEEEEEALCMQRLIDTGFNIPDCGVYFLNDISGAFMMDDEKTFEGFIKQLIKQVEIEFNLHTSGTVKTTDEINDHFNKIINWLKSI